MNDQPYKVCRTPEKRRHPYMKKSWWKDVSNFWWRSGMYKQEFIDKMDDFASQVSSIESGCYFKIIPNE